MDKKLKTTKQNVLLFLIILLSGLLHSVFAQNSKRAFVWSDGRITWVNAQNQYLFNSESKSSKVLETNSGITWLVTFEDVLQQTGKHFDDPQLGASRQNALYDVLNEIAETLNTTRNSQIKVLIQKSYESNSILTLASASTTYNCCANSFQLGSAGTHIQTGIDPQPNLDDVLITVNFGYKWYFGSGKPAPNEFDLRSVLLHEVTHTLGIASLLDSNGKSRLSSTNPGVFSQFDYFLKKYTSTNIRTNLFNVVEKRFVGSPSDLIGQNVTLRFFGFYPTANFLTIDPQIYSPNPFKTGSSLSHFSSNFSRNALMLPDIRPGYRRRHLQHFEVGILMDLGYKTAKVFGSELFTFKKPKEITPVAGNSISSTLINDLNNDGTLDYLTLQQGSTGSILVINNRKIPLGSKFYYSMSLSEEIGPEYKKGIILEERNGTELLALAEFINSSSNTVRGNFGYVHSAYSTLPFSSGSLRKQSYVALGDVNGDGKQDAVSILQSTSPGGKGIVSYLNYEGYFDGHFKTTKVLDLQGTQIIYGLAAEKAHSLIYIPFTYSLSDPPGSIAWIDSKRLVRLTDLSPTTPTGYFKSISADYGYNMYAVRKSTALPGDEILALKMNGNPQYQISNSLYIPGGVSDVLHYYNALAETNSLYFINNHNHSIEKMNTVFGTYSRVAGGSAGYDDGNSINAKFNNPTNLCASDNNLWVIDSGNKLIRRVELSTKRVYTLAGVLNTTDGRDGQRDFATFNLEDGAQCWATGDSLYILDSTDYNERVVRKININTGYTITLPISPSAPFINPKGFKGFANQVFTVLGNPSSKALYKTDLQPPYTRVGSIDLLKLAKLNNDNCEDAVGSWGGIISIYLSNCNGTFRYIQQPNINSTRASEFTLGDFNEDGRTDLVITGGTRIEFFYGAGDGTFQLSPNTGFFVDAPPLSIQAGDFDRNGVADLVILDELGELKIFNKDVIGSWTGNSGSIGEVFSMFVGTSEIPKWFSLEDFNNDGKLDLSVGFETGKTSISFLGK